MTAATPLLDWYASYLIQIVLFIVFLWFADFVLIRHSRVKSLVRYIALGSVFIAFLLAILAIGELR